MRLLSSIIILIGAGPLCGLISITSVAGEMSFGDLSVGESWILPPEAFCLSDHVPGREGQLWGAIKPTLVASDQTREGDALVATVYRTQEGAFALVHAKQSSSAPVALLTEFIRRIEGECPADVPPILTTVSVEGINTVTVVDHEVKIGLAK